MGSSETPNLTAEYISPAIFLLKKYVREKCNVIKSINGSHELSQQKAETEAMIHQFDLTVRTFENSIKPLDKKIQDSLHLLLIRQQKVQERRQPPQLTPLECPPQIAPPNQFTVNNLETRTTTTLSIPRVLSVTPIASKVASEEDVSNNISITNNRTSHQSNQHSCLFCNRIYTSRTSLTRHIREEHPKHSEVYEEISSLTPEYMLASDATVGGNRQCFYCNAPFRSNAPLLRHIQEQHVDYYEIFYNISLCRGDKMHSLKSVSTQTSRLTMPVITSRPQPSTCKLSK